MATSGAKLLLLLLFLVLVFLLTRLLEIISSRDLSFLRQKLIKPLELAPSKHGQSTVQQMKAVLDQRGVSYRLVVEKGDLHDLVNNTGEMSQEELLAALAQQRSSVDLPRTTVFNSSSYFNELVEDVKDSVWLLDVDRGGGGGAKVPEAVWRSTVRRYSRFGVRVGRVDCSVLWRLCHQWGIDRGGLVLALPHGKDLTKDSVDYHIFPQPSYGYLSEKVWEWIDELLSRRVLNLTSATQLVKKYPYEDSDGWFDRLVDWRPTPPLDIVLIKKGRTRSLLMSALSVKFTGRVHFWALDVSSPEGKALLETVKTLRPSFSLERDGKKKLPAYVLFTPLNEYVFGSGPGEYLSFSSMDLFLRCVQPEANDLFLLGLGMVNLLALLQLATKQGSTLVRCLSAAWCAVLFNVVYLLMCLPVLGLFSLRSMSFLMNAMLSGVRYLALSHTAGLIRRDILTGMYNLWALSAEFAVYLLLIGWFERWRTGGVDQDITDDQDDTTWQMPDPHLIDLESGEGVDLLRSLYFLDLRLPADQPPGYIGRLPVWTCSIGSPVNSTTEEEEDALPETSNWPAGVLYASRCVICLERFMSGVQLCALPCGHAFHDSCVKTWLVTTGRSACPTCRWPASKKKML